MPFKNEFFKKIFYFEEQNYGCPLWREKALLQDFICICGRLHTGRTYCEENWQIASILGQTMHGLCWPLWDQLFGWMHWRMARSGTKKIFTFFILSIFILFNIFFHLSFWFPFFVNQKPILQPINITSFCLFHQVASIGIKFINFWSNKIYQFLVQIKWVLNHLNHIFSFCFRYSNFGPKLDASGFDL